MKKSLVYALLAVALMACKQKQPTGPNPQLAKLFDTYWDARSKYFPLEATQQGDNRYNNILVNDQTQAFRDSLKAFYQQYLDEVKKFNYDELDENDKISVDMFTYYMDMQLKGLGIGVVNSQPSWMIPTQQFWGLTITMGQLGSGESFQPFKTVADYNNWLGRIKGFSLWADSAIANYRQGIATGMVLPKVLVEKMLPQMDGMVVTDPTKSLFYDPVKKLPASF